MVKEAESMYPICGGQLKYYDRTRRKVKVGNGNNKSEEVFRRICIVCGHTHRVVPDDLFPYKQYAETIILGFLAGSMSSYNLDYEDYPCEGTIKNWKKEFSK